MPKKTAKKSGQKAAWGSKGSRPWTRPPNAPPPHETRQPRLLVCALHDDRGRPRRHEYLQAKRRDLQTFLDYFLHAVGTDQPDQWTRSMTEGFLKHLLRERKPPLRPRRVLALRARRREPRMRASSTGTPYA